MAIWKALASGAVGSCVLTLVHETARRLVPNAPRMDVIGMRAIARPMREIGEDPPPRDTLFSVTMAGDLAGNALYYSLVGLGGAKNALVRGAMLGAAAGLGGAFLPPVLGLGQQPGAHFPATQAMTTAWYLVGGLAAGAAYRSLAPGD